MISPTVVASFSLIAGNYQNADSLFEVHKETAEIANHPITARLLEQLNGVEIQGAILIAVGDNIIYHRFGGDLSLMDKEPIDRNTRFAIGSVSKQFTAAALLQQLYRQGGMQNVKTALKQPISTYLLPSHSIWGEHYPNWADHVTLHHLLTHSSGLKDFTSDPAFENQKFNQTPHSPTEYLAIVRDQELSFEPGSDTLYSNTNYLLLAEILHSLCGSDLSSYLNSLCNEIGMSNTWAPLSGSLDELRSLDDQLAGVVDSGGRPTLDNFSCARGCGSLISTPQDLLKWNLALHKYKTIVPDEIYQIMTTSYINEEGYGIGVESTSRGTTILGHQGYLNGFESCLLYEPDSEVSIIVLSNSYKHHEQILEVVFRELDAPCS